MTPTQPPLGATPEPSKTPLTDENSANWDRANRPGCDAYFAAELEVKLATARAALAQCEERLKESQGPAETARQRCIAAKHLLEPIYGGTNLAPPGSPIAKSLDYLDEAIDALSHIISHGFAREVEQLAGTDRDTSRKPHSQPPPEHRCRHGILAGHCPECPTMEDIERKEAAQAARRKGYHAELPARVSVGLAAKLKHAEANGATPQQLENMMLGKVVRP